MMISKPGSSKQGAESRHAAEHSHRHARRRGIGAATCLELAVEGWSVAVNYAEDESAARRTVDAIRERGGRAEVFRGDVADSADVARLFEGAVAGIVPYAATKGAVETFTRGLAIDQPAREYASTPWRRA
jgi:NAD(P)-dependent dehydrogenase (short-subunit alcohol dehydrogenase family)